MRAQRPQREIVAHPLAARGEQSLENVRQREDGRAEVERVALRLQQIQLAADLGVLLKNFDRISGLPE